jgi:hypothetical protein
MKIYAIKDKRTKDRILLCKMFGKLVAKQTIKESQYKKLSKEEKKNWIFYTEE